MIWWKTKVSLWRWAMVALFMAIFGCLATYTNVSVEITTDDIGAFAELGLNKFVLHSTYEQEIALIRKVQLMVFERAPLNSIEGIPNYQSREPSDLLRIGKGLCYDTIRTLDKALAYLGFETRHVYLLFKVGRPFVSALFHYQQPSHAVTEVKTSRGWLFVDSNSAWLAVNRRGEPVNADEVWRRYEEFENSPVYLVEPWWAIRGLYSRRGQFYGAGIPFPEVNWKDFLHWLVLGK